MRTYRKILNTQRHRSVVSYHDPLLTLTLDNTLQANIIFLLASGQPIAASKAACTLLGYTKKQLLTKKGTDIIDVTERVFKKILKANTKKTDSNGLTFIKKNGHSISCEVTSAVIKDGSNDKIIIAFRDNSSSIFKQRQIDTKNEKTVARNIAIANSKQKSIDIKNSKKVADNIALAKSRQISIDIKNAKKVARDIVIAISKQIKIDAKKEKIVRENIAYAKAKQINIDIKNAKKLAEDIVIAISKQIKIDAVKEKIVRDNILLAISKQKNIDVENAKTVAGNIVLALSEQKKIDINKEKIVADNIKLALDKYVEEKSNYEIETIKNNLNSHNELQGRLNEEISANEKLLFQNDKFNLILNSSSDVLFDNDLETGKVVISDAYEKEYGYQTNSNMTPAADWIEHIHPEDKEGVYHELQSMLSSQEVEWTYSYRFLRANDEVVNVFSKAVILRNKDGKAYRILGYMRDNSKQKVLEERLEHDIKLKEQQIDEAMKEAKETERSEIGKELHDNVNQLLGASKLYLEMAKGGGKESEMYLKRSTEYTLNAIEEIRKLTKGLTTDHVKNLGLTEAIKNITRDTMEVNPLQISLMMESFTEENVDDKFKLNLFRIVQEQLNNILKHAQATTVNITLSNNKKSIILTISDNGLGFDINKKCTGIGLSNIKSRAASYNGTAEFVSQTGSGCVLITTFPVIEPTASLN